MGPHAEFDAVEFESGELSHAGGEAGGDAVEVIRKQVAAIAGGTDTAETLLGDDRMKPIQQFDEAGSIARRCDRPSS
jgi:hypothetical protein